MGHLIYVWNNYDARIYLNPFVHIADKLLWNQAQILNQQAYDSTSI